jgi:6-phosphogluconolactonase (cycloisomerase 2 family)
MRTRLASLSFVLLFVLASSAWAQALGVIQVLDRRTGLAGIQFVLNSPDGEQVYVVAEGTVSVFDRNAATGNLTFRELYRDQTAGFRGLAGVSGAVIAPDGGHLYLLRRDARSVTILGRDEDGLLRFVGEQPLVSTRPSAGIPGSLAITPDGETLYVTLGIFPGSSILAFDRDPATGTLSLVEEEVAADLSGPLAVSPDGDFLYAGIGDGVATFTIGGSGALTLLGPLRRGMPGVDDQLRVDALAVSPDGRHVYASSAADSITFVLRREASGQLSYGSKVPSPDPFFANVRPLVLSPDGANVYVCRELEGRIEVYGRDAASGSLALTSTFRSENPPPSCKAMAVSPDGRNLYTPGQFDQSLLVLARQASGALSLVDTVEEGEGAPAGLPFVHSVAVSGDGEHVYAADSVSGLIGFFRRDEATGRLSFVEALAATVETLVLSPDGAFLYGLQPDGGIAIFRRDAGTGEISPAGVHATDFPESECRTDLAVSPDGRNLYVSLFFQSAVAVYARNATTGQVSLLEVVHDGVGQPGGQPAFPTSVAVSPDGRNVYMTISDPGGVVVFRRAQGTGRLTRTQVVREINSACSPHGLLLASDVAVSPDGRQVYAATSFERLLHIFSRNQQNGRLSYFDCTFPHRVARIAFSPDGRFLYGVDPSDGAVAVFYRSPTSGVLTFVGGFPIFYQNGGSPVVSPDGRNVYVPAGDGGLVVLGGSTDDPEQLACTSQAGTQSLCMNQERFKIRVRWRDFDGNEGDGVAVPLTSDSGYFWFFDSANVELVIKVLDGRGVNGHFWVFYGSLSSVEYTITVLDTATGRLRFYTNPSGALASVADTEAFPAGAQATALAAPVSLSPEEIAGALGLVALPAEAEEEPVEGTCEASPTRLCLGNKRFAITVAWKDFSGNQGTGKATRLTFDTGYFWFFGEDNVEIAAKVLDGRAINRHYWVFFASLTSVEFRLTVTDTVTGASKSYVNPSGRLASRADTAALPAE